MLKDLQFLREELTEEFGAHGIVNNTLKAWEDEPLQLDGVPLDEINQEYLLMYSILVSVIEQGGYEDTEHMQAISYGMDFFLMTNDLVEQRYMVLWLMEITVEMADEGVNSKSLNLHYLAKLLVKVLNLNGIGVAMVGVQNKDTGDIRIIDSEIEHNVGIQQLLDILNDEDVE